MATNERMWGFGPEGMWSSNSPTMLRKWTRLGLWYALVGAASCTGMTLYGEHIPILGRDTPILPFFPEFTLLDLLITFSALWTVLSGLIFLLNFGHWVALSGEDRTAARGKGAAATPVVPPPPSA